MKTLLCCFNHQKKVGGVKKAIVKIFSQFRVLTFDTHIKHCAEAVEAKTEAGFALKISEFNDKALTKSLLYENI